MKSFDLQKVHDLLLESEMRAMSMHIVRRFEPEWEAVFEIHRAQRADFLSPEDFLRHSLLNLYRVTTSEAAFDELEVFDGGQLLNRASTSSELELLYQIFSPLAKDLPQAALIREAITLGEQWNMVWVVMSCEPDDYVAARWFTTA